jgi:Mlc titration factor MtfA (ptsG expression regulator)
LFGFLRKRRRARLRAQPFSEAWERILEKRLLLWRKLSAEQREELRRRMQVFLAEKHFEGCGGVTLTDDMRVTIAGHACALTLGHDADYYPGLASILVYPKAFLVEHDELDDSGVIQEGPDALEGESWSSGAVVFSWEDGRFDAAYADGRNVFYHEFAHQLFDRGLPGFQDRTQADHFAEVFAAGYAAHVEAVDAGRRTTIDPYGAEAETEFFSVCTEMLFEQPRRLAMRHPDLFAAIRDYYRLDLGNTD